MDELNRIAGQAWDDGEAAYNVGKSAVEQEGAHVGINGILDVSKLATALNAVGVVVTLVQARNWLRTVFIRLPKVIAQPAVNLLDALIFPAENLGEQAVHALQSHASTVVHSHIQSVGWAAKQSGILQEAYDMAFNKIPSAGPQVGPTPLNAQFNTLQGEINTLAGRVTALGYSIGIAQNHEGVPANFANEVHYLQAQMAQQIRVNEQQSTAMENLADTQARLQQQFDYLTTQIHGLRQVSTGWQDVQQELGRMGAVLTKVADDTATDLHHQQRQLTHLAPLALLLQAGVGGLKTLRQLEDTPCMCPRVPQHESAIALALATMEFVENG
jgi:hypothetical protein